MSSKIDIQVKEIKKINYKIIKKELSNSDFKFSVPINSKLVLEFDGKDINNVIINTFKRTVDANIPTYAFPSSLIQITDNTSIYNNDMIRLKLSQLPILNVDSGLYFLEQKYWKNVDFADAEREKHTAEKKIDFYINIVNDTNEILNVTTSDIIVDSDQIKNNYNKICPLLITQLKPKQKLNCKMQACLGVGELNNIWSPVCLPYFDDKTTDDLKGEFIEKKNGIIEFTIESHGQLSEYVILIKACDNIIYKLQEINKLIQENYEEISNIESDIGVKRKLTKNILNDEKSYDNKAIEFIFDDEDHTIGYLINNSFQDHNDIVFSGISKPDRLIKSVTIKIVCKENIESPVNAMSEQIQYLVKIFAYLKDKFIKMNK